MIQQCQRLMRGVQKPILLVVDGHPAPKLKLVKEFVEEQEDRLTLAYLPPYSPQLNPDKQVWGYLKSHVATKGSMNKIKLMQVVVSCLSRLQKLPHIVQSFFKHPDCQYATS